MIIYTVGEVFFIYILCRQNNELIQFLGFPFIKALHFYLLSFLTIYIKCTDIHTGRDRLGIQHKIQHSVSTRTLQYFFQSKTLVSFIISSITRANTSLWVLNKEYNRQLCWPVLSEFPPKTISNNNVFAPNRTVRIAHMHWKYKKQHIFGRFIAHISWKKAQPRSTIMKNKFYCSRIDNCTWNRDPYTPGIADRYAITQ